MKSLSAIAVAFAMLGAVVPASAQLSATERTVCATPMVCLDILSRNAPDAFDYNVLAAEFARFGEPATDRLVALARRPDTAPRVFALAGSPAATPGLRARLHDLWPVPSPDLHVQLGRAYASDVLRARAVATLNAGPLRAASLRALATQTQPLSPALAARLGPDLLKAVPAPETVALLAQLPDTQGVPGLLRALDVADADTVVAAFLALERLDAAQARKDLEAAFRRSTDAPVWARALELAGRDSRTFDAIAFGHATYADEGLPAPLRAAALHAALLYPAGDKGDVDADAAPLVAELAKLPVAARLADTAASHTLFADPRHLQALAGAWRGADAARFAASIGKAGRPDAAPVLQALFDRTADYRVQVAAVDALSALGFADDRWLETRTARHPIRAVQVAGARARKTKASALPRGCFAVGSPRKDQAERLPFFQSGRFGDAPAGRWSLNDANAFPGGWLAAYDQGLIRYASDDTAENVVMEGSPVAIVADPVLAGQVRPTGFWVLSKNSDAARLYRYTVAGGLSAPSTLPPSASIVTADTPRGWAVAFTRDSGQPTLAITPEGRIVSACTTGLVK